MDFSEKYKQLWSDWGIRVLMLLSMSFQIILIFLSRLRKTSTSKWIRMFVWSSYLLANWLADFVLGQLSSAMDDSSSSNAIIAFWAPFLILHLGGPDTITAYSMEDNELWLRHLVSLIYELIIAFYVFVRSLPTTRLLPPTILIFFVAIVKYVERSYSLYNASTEGFRRSIKSSNINPPPNFFFLTSKMAYLNALNGAFGLYSFFKLFFVDFYTTISGEPYFQVQKYYEDMTAEDIFKVTSMELSYAYDELYTKAAINHTRVGYVLRALCSICILLAFSLYVLTPKEGFHELDVAITYVLLAASIILDTIATIMFMFSDWMIATLLNVKKLDNFSKLLAKLIFRIKRVLLKRKYWLGEMPQLNIINNCLKNSTPNKAPRQRMMDWIKEKLSLLQVKKLYLIGSNYYETFTMYTLRPIQATEELKDIITTYTQRGILACYKKFGEPTSLLDLQEVTIALNWVNPSFFEHISELKFDQQVLVWHISTELCFHWNSELHPLYPHQILTVAEDNKPRSSKMKVCQYLSNYMMYLVQMRPETMSSMGAFNTTLIGETFSSMVQFSHRHVDKNHLSKPDAKIEELCRKMLTTPIQWLTDEILFDIAKVLAYLMLLIKDEDRWHVLATVWADLLIQEAKNTKAITHVKQLSRGGDLLTFVWLLTKHIAIQEILDYRSSKIDNLMPMAKELLPMIKDRL